MSSLRFKSYAPSAHTQRELIPLPLHEDFSVVGSFAHDQLNGYDYCWKSIEEAEAWRIQEEKSKTIELRHKETRISPPVSSDLWSEKRYYVCSRGHSGGKSQYVKKHNHVRKIPNKLTGCKCRITLKLYHHTGEVLGRYTNEHNHDIGNKNARFTRLRTETRDEIERLLRLGVKPHKVLEQVQGSIYSESNISNLYTSHLSRHEFCTRADVRRIEKMIEEESVRLAQQDGPSILKWVAKLQSKGHFVELKTANNAPPVGSGLADDAFILIIQTKYQKECWKAHGHRFAGIDATHNTTHYENMSLFTLLSRDKWGHGIPTAWMISSNGTGETIAYFLKSIRNQTPDVVPQFFMSDKDRAQLNAIEYIYPESIRFLCWWHVLHAWQKHFNTSEFPALWTLLKAWIRIEDEDKFNKQWEKIKEAAPKSVVEYLETNWMNETDLWSAVFRANRTVFQDCDTNMLLEAWHHLLKGTFMVGKRNRRLDHLIYILTERAMPYFMHRHRRQANGFEGPDLEVKKRIEIIARSQSVLPGNIKETSEEDVYMVKSSSSDVEYRVDLDAYDCSCLSFPLIRFCKHICAVECEYSSAEAGKQPVSSLDIHYANTIDKPRQSSGQETPDATITGRSLGAIKDVILVNDLSQLAIMLQDMRFFEDMSAQHATTLRSLQDSVRDAMKAALDVNTKSKATKDLPLPSKEPIAPNQHSWPQTAAVMGVPVKSKRKVHTDPYAGGEQSGKKAKKDAKKPLPKEVPALSTFSAQTPIIPPALSFLPSFIASNPHQTFPVSFPTPQISMEDYFDPSDVDLQTVTVDFLKGLGRDKLYKLCNFHHISMARSHLDTAVRLKAVSHDSDLDARDQHIYISLNSPSFQVFKRATDRSRELLFAQSCYDALRALVVEQ